MAHCLKLVKGKKSGILYIFTTIMQVHTFNYLNITSLCQPLGFLLCQLSHKTRNKEEFGGFLKQKTKAKLILAFSLLLANVVTQSRSVKMEVFLGDLVARRLFGRPVIPLIIAGVAFFSSWKGIIHEAAAHNSLQPQANFTEHTPVTISRKVFGCVSQCSPRVGGV